MSDVTGGNVADFLGGSGGAELSNMLKLEQAYLLILPPSSPAMGMAETLAAIAGAEAIGTGMNVAGQEAGNAAPATQTAQEMLGGNLGNKVTFMLNPHSYSISKMAFWERWPDPTTINTSIPMWRGPGPRQLSMEIMLDASLSENGGVAFDVELLFACCQPTMLSILMEAPSPPFVMFGWGITTSFIGYMESVSAEYTLFRPDGTPLRARCQIAIQEIPTAFPMQNPTSGGSIRRTRTVVSGDTLQSVAQREYGKPTMWRAIAHINDIEDPLRLTPGTTLLIPPLDEAAALA